MSSWYYLRWTIFGFIIDSDVLKAYRTYLQTDQWTVKYLLRSITQPVIIYVSNQDDYLFYSKITVLETYQYLTKLHLRG